MKAPSEVIYGKSTHGMLKSTFSGYNAVSDEWRYGSIFIRLAIAVVESQIPEIPPNFLKIRTYTVQGHPRSSILVSIKSTHATSLVINSNFERISYNFYRAMHFSAKRGIAIACLSVCPSVCLSVCLSLYL